MIYVISHPSLPTAMLSDALASIDDYKCRCDKPLPSSDDSLIILFDGTEPLHAHEYHDLIDGIPDGMRVIVFGIIDSMKSLIITPKINSSIEIVYGLPSHIHTIVCSPATYLTQMSESKEWRKNYADFFESWKVPIGEDDKTNI